MRLITWSWVLLLALLLPGPLRAEQRLALVMGNAAYPSPDALKNSANDARDMAAVLKKLGFEVILQVNAGRDAMNDAVQAFGDKLGDGAVGLFYYSGHGMQVNGRNYAVPVDANITTEQSVRLQTLDIDAVLDQMQAAHTRLSLVILDACRSNPFERRFRGAGGGLAQMNAPKGTLIAYATAPGKTASDGERRNGLYTTELLTAMTTPGISIEQVFKQIRLKVSAASDEAQIPWEASSLTGDFFFIPPSAPAAVGIGWKPDRIGKDGDGTGPEAAPEADPPHSLFGTITEAARDGVAGLKPSNAPRTHKGVSILSAPAFGTNPP
jgi:uncharacterized caspase-like protein